MIEKAQDLHVSIVQEKKKERYIIKKKINKTLYF